MVSDESRMYPDYGSLLVGVPDVVFEHCDSA